MLRFASCATMLNMNKTICRRCAGTGYEVDHSAVGQEYRARRERLGHSLRTVASTVGVSVAYLSDLERGHRAWNANITERVNAAYARLERMA